MRARIRVVTTPGEAKKILEYKAPNGEPSGLLINYLLRNHVKNAHLMGARTDLGYVLQYLSKNADFVLPRRSEEHSSELQSLFRISYAVFCLKNNTLAIP